jgi:hypothetical protein
VTGLVLSLNKSMSSESPAPQLPNGNRGIAYVGARIAGDPIPDSLDFQSLRLLIDLEHVPDTEIPVHAIARGPVRDAGAFVDVGVVEQ